MTMNFAYESLRMYVAAMLLVHPHVLKCLPIHQITNGETTNTHGCSGLAISVDEPITDGGKEFLSWEYGSVNLALNAL